MGVRGWLGVTRDGPLGYLGAVYESAGLSVPRLKRTLISTIPRIDFSAMYHRRGQAFRSAGTMQGSKTMSIWKSKIAQMLVPNQAHQTLKSWR